MRPAAMRAVFFCSAMSDLLCKSAGKSKESHRLPNLMINEQVVPVGTTWIERGCERTAAISRAQGIML